MRTIIEVKNLYKYYKETKAVDGISFEVYEGEIFGMVGPNGAGKTTTIECIEGLRRPDKGIINVLGVNILKEKYPVEKIGIQLQESLLYPRIKVKEAIQLFASFYAKPVVWKDLLKKLGLQDKENVYYEKLSGGLKKRLQLALTLIGNAELLFFDEITTGLDPQARHNMWELIKELRNQGKTIFITTHYMEEAQELCDRVCIIDHGRILVLDKPEILIQNLTAESKLILTITEPFELKIIEDLPCVSKIKRINEQVIIYGKRKEFLIEIIQTLSRHNLAIQNLQLKQPMLEDVYLDLTGREYRD